MQGVKNFTVVRFRKKEWVSKNNDFELIAKQKMINNFKY